MNERAMSEVAAKRIVGILDRATIENQQQDPHAVLDRALQAGLRTFLFRQAGFDAAELWVWKALQEHCAAAGARVLRHANTPLDDALCWGVHFPSSALTMRSIGRHAAGFSTHNAAEFQRALALGASWLTLSPYQQTSSKPGYGPALGAAGVAAVIGGARVAVFALAGVSAENVKGLGAAGAAGVAVMGMLTHPRSVEELRELVEVMEDEPWTVQTPW